MKLIDRNTLDDTFTSLNKDGWQLTQYEHERMENVLFNMPEVDAIPLSVIDEIKAEIMEQFEGCDICRWDEDYDYEENNISEYKYIDSICSILKIIDEKVKEHET